MSIHNGEKQCRNHCPICGGQDIEWSRIEDAEAPYQSGECKECGCEFDELYKYCTTTFLKNKITPAEQLAKAAKEIVDDFDEYGKVLQADIRSEYTPETSIEILRMAIKKYEEEQK
jgi:hypothetical protein